MKYLVLTPWDGKNEDLLEKCRNSVSFSLGKIVAEHRVVRCGRDWEEIMFDMRNDADFVAWVDADDVVYENALERAFSTLEDSDVGMVFTDEAIIDINGNHKRYNSGERQLLDLASHPGPVHHLVVTKKDTIDNVPLEVYKKFANFNQDFRGAPLDWLMRARCGCQYGMKRIPMVGYGWRESPNQITKDPSFHKVFESNLKPIRQITRSWVNWSKNISR